ncbi:WXG100 family type VII secretion target [Bacillus cereus]|nr:WXG100 family type VII secretion target [Bacillus cereus]
MTQIKVTPEQLEQVAKTVRNTGNSLKYIHKDLCNQTEYIASQWSGAIVRSRSKPPFDYLEEIPPTKVRVIRKND